MINPLTVRQTLRGQVVLELVPLSDLMVMERKVTQIDSTKLVKCLEYKAHEGADTVFRSVAMFNYLQYPRVSAEVFSFQHGIALTHFPKTIERKLTTIDARTIELKDFYWSGTHNHEVAMPHTLILNYNKRGQLVKINEAYSLESGKSNSITWRYRYKQGQLHSVAVADMTSLYQYNDNGQLISIILYTGKAIHSPYLCADSLKAMRSKKLDTYQMRQILDNANSEVHELAFYTYSEGRLTEMVCYDSNSGIQKTTVTYDSLQRVSSIHEDHIFGGLELTYTYEAHNNHLLERRERVLSDCFTRGCPETEVIETYTYNPDGLVSEIKHKTYNHNSDGTKTIAYDTGRGKRFQYINANK